MSDSSEIVKNILYNVHFYLTHSTKPKNILFKIKQRKAMEKLESSAVVIDVLHVNMMFQTLSVPPTSP